jgi:hypothetical protein
MLWEENALLKREQLMRDVSQKPFEKLALFIKDWRKGRFQRQQTMISMF